jgi:hypothetical protein
VTPLFDPARHEPLAGAVWSAAAVHAAVRRIADDALATMDPQRGHWPAHPLDDPERPDQHDQMLYTGAGGMLLALQRLAQDAGIAHGLDIAALLPGIIDRLRVQTQAWGLGDGAWLMGETGLRVLQWHVTHDDAIAQRVAQGVEADFEHPSNEALWGSPGSLLGAIFLAEAGAPGDWRALITRGVERIVERMSRHQRLGVWICEQDLYGRRSAYLGAGHGLAGNVYPALRGAAWLPAELVAQVTERTLAALQATALRDESGRVNWPPWVDTPPERLPLVQDCHGAPGIVVRCAHAPRTTAWDQLLGAAGELVWHAGPLAKGPGLCHGTAGNGYAFLALYRRTGEASWLERARAFAMHALTQVDAARATHGRGRYSLWTGDVGAGLYALDCERGGFGFPTLERFLP